MERKKLIEVALPLDAINAASSREKSIRHGHPSTLHLWWARRPLAAARAVIWASLVDDPSSHPEEFSTEEDQQKERERLFDILERLVIWENSNNKEVLDEAKAEILKSTDGNPPELLDPFAGGGSIPLEGQRLGLKVHAHDLNPVAVMINKAMIEIPPRFANMPPVNPEARAKFGADHGWEGAAGLAEDVRYYGELLKKKAFEKIGHLYPKVRVPEEQGGGDAAVIAWIWSRTVKCSNPVCGRIIPLFKTYDLSSKKGAEIHFEIIDGDNGLRTIVKEGKSKKKGIIDRHGAICPFCNATIEFSYIRSEFQDNRMGSQLLAIVLEGRNGRIFIAPDEQQIKASIVERPEVFPSGQLSGKSRVNVSLYGFDETGDLFCDRQAVMLKGFCDILEETIKEIETDATESNLSEDSTSISEGGDGCKAYSEAVGVYLAFAIDKLTDAHSTIVTWNVGRDGIRNTFARQAIPMSWDYAEANPFSNSSGCFDNCLEWVEKCVLQLPCGVESQAIQFDAQSDNGLKGIMVSTDPPYYDNISYADLSDYFYVWMRNNLKNIYPSLFQTMLVPKNEELVATPYRFDSKVEDARRFFESGMQETCKRLCAYSREDIPVTIYYAYKQSEDVENGSTGEVEKTSSGWETMLTAIIDSGFSITGTWPMRTERASRSVGIGSNALASSIIIVCRKKDESASSTTRRNLVNELKRELRPALKHLQQSNIAPVDLAQSAIGPGMAVFSKYSQVLEADGTPMTVRSALQIINQELDIYFNEQDGELDRDSRFCVDLYTQCAFNDIKFGDADTLARAKNTSVSALEARDVVYAKKGVVHLLERKDIPEKVNTNESMIWLLTQQLTHAMETGGVEACAKIVFSLKGFTNVENAKSLAYRLYTIAERKGWAQEAYAYNSLVISWQDIQSRVAQMTNIETTQMSLFDNN